MQELALVLQHEEQDPVFLQSVVMAATQAQRGSGRNWRSQSPTLTQADKRCTYYSLELLGLLGGCAASATERLSRTPCEEGYRTPSPGPSLDATVTLEAIFDSCRYLQAPEELCAPVWCARALRDLALFEPRAPLPARIPGYTNSFPDFCRVLAALTSVLPYGAAGQGGLHPQAAVMGTKRRRWRGAQWPGGEDRGGCLPSRPNCMSLILQWLWSSQRVGVGGTCGEALRLRVPTPQPPNPPPP